MTDISVFTRMLEQPVAPLPDYVRPRWIWICASKSQGQTGQFYYRVGNRKHPLSKLFTRSLADARAVAETYGLPVKEYGPPEAFGRKPKSAPLSAATVDEFWHVVGLNDPDRLKTWIANHLKDAPALRDIIETGHWVAGS